MAYLHFFVADACSLAEADHQCGCNGARPKASLLTTSRDDGVNSDPRTSAHVARTDTHRAVDLVSRDGHQVDVHLVDVHGDLANGLSSVSVEEHLVTTAKLANLRKRLLDTDLVVDSHDRNKTSLRPDGLRQLVHVDQAVVLHGQVCDLEAFVLQMSAAVQDTLVFCLTSDDVVLLARSLEEPGHTLDAHVVALCCSRCEDDLFRISTNQVGDVCASLFNSVVRLPTVGMCSRMRVTVKSCEERKHGVKHSRVCRRGGLHVHVDGSGAFVHHGRLLQDSGGGTHHSIGAHARRRHRGILGLDTSLGEECLLIFLDGLLNVDSGVLGRRLGDIGPSALRSNACSGQLLCERLRRR